MSERIWVLLWKEWAELGKRKGLIVSTLLPPFAILMLSLTVALLAVLVPEGDPDNEGFPPEILAPLLLMQPELAELSRAELSSLFVIRQMMQFLLLPPIITAMSIATYSVVGEKVNRTLEPLLSTPLTSFELLLGKCLAAAIPSIALSWAVSILYAAGIQGVAPKLLPYAFDATAIILLVLGAPLVAVLGLGLGVVVSSRASDPRSAQQVGIVLIAPFVAIFIAQMQGALYLTPAYVLLGSLIVAGLDLLVLLVGARLFQRETILTRWK